MNQQNVQQIAQMAAEGKLKPSQGELIDQILKDVMSETGIVPSDARNIRKIRDYINLLRRQAAKAKNQRKTLKNLHKVYWATMMENRWLRETIKASGISVWVGIRARARETLWSIFKKENR